MTSPSSIQLEAGGRACSTIESSSESLRANIHRLIREKQHGRSRPCFLPGAEATDPWPKERILRGMLTIFGACAVTFLMLIYAFERRDRRFILAFARGSALSSVYGFLAGTWPFGVVEAIWAASRCVATRSPGISLDQLQLKAQAGRAAGNAAVTDGVDAILVSVLAVLALGQHETVKAV